MVMQRWSRTTRVKLLGGEIIYKEAGDDFVGLSKKLVGTRRRAFDLRPVFADFEPVWYEQEQEIFALEGAPVRWPGLSPAYAAWKDIHFPAQTIMRATDRLYNSLTSRSPDTIWEVAPRTLRFGTRVPYFGFHTEGIGVPVRRTLTMLPSTFRQLNRMVMQHVTAELRSR